MWPAVCLLMLQMTHRVVLIHAAGADDPKLLAQEKLLQAEAGGVTERDIEVKRAIEPGRAFAVELIGKDGGVKLRRKEPVSAEELFRLIDAMPMRRQEMKRK